MPDPIRENIQIYRYWRERAISRVMKNFQLKRHADAILNSDAEDSIDRFRWIATAQWWEIVGQAELTEIRRKSASLSG